MAIHRAEQVSIHAPAKEATCAPSWLWHIATCFNPRPREGGDRHVASLQGIRQRFNPRPREGGDARTTPTPALTCWFQSTPPRRRRLHQKRRPRRATGFQSTPPRRRRPGHVFPDNPGRLVSIHAPAKEATACRCRIGQPTSCFNPRPREGGDSW